VTLAAEHGYTFTSEEAQSAWDAAPEGELSDFEMHMVSGGIGPAGIRTNEGKCG
jgi:hypothetical protein